MRWSLFPGRFQPFHNGHKAQVDHLLAQGKRVAIAIRDTPTSESDPYSVYQRQRMIRAVYADEMDKGRVMTEIIPDIEGIYYGRRVGFNVEQIELPDEVEAVSATKVRAGAPDVPPEVAEYLEGLKR